MEEILQRLDKTNGYLEQILAAVSERESKWRSTVELLASGVGIAGIVSVIEQLINWIGG
jgi:hypothetical protein